MSEVIDKPAAKQKQETTLAPEKQKAKLDMWTYDGERLHGIVYDHPLLPDGEYITTTRVEWIDWNTKIAETRNTIYILLRKAT